MEDTINTKLSLNISHRENYMLKRASNYSFFAIKIVEGGFAEQ